MAETRYHIVAYNAECTIRSRGAVHGSLARPLGVLAPFFFLPFAEDAKFVEPFTDYSFYSEACPREFRGVVLGDIRGDPGSHDKPPLPPQRCLNKQVSEMIIFEV